jgi:hypothetical protein
VLQRRRVPCRNAANAAVRRDITHNPLCQSPGARYRYTPHPHSQSVLLISAERYAHCMSLSHLFFWYPLKVLFILFWLPGFLRDVCRTGWGPVWREVVWIWRDRC